MARVSTQAVPSRTAASSSTKRQPAMSSQPSLAIAAGAYTNPEIERLLLDQKRVQEERKRVAPELKNAQRRKRRLRTKARQLSNEDILAVLLMRQEQGTAQATGDEDENASAADSTATGSCSAPSSSSPATMPEQD